MLILSTVRFWELSRACSIVVYKFDNRVYMDVFTQKEHVTFIYLGELGDSKELIAASIDKYFEEEKEVLS